MELVAHFVSVQKNFVSGKGRTQSPQSMAFISAVFRWIKTMGQWMFLPDDM